MRDLSLHILDLIENSVRAGASVVSLTVEEDSESDLLRIVIEDNGPGLDVPPERALDPFYTTKAGKRTGLGLSFFRAAAEQAGGGLALGRSELGGLAVEARMRLGHVNRSPMGDLAATVASVVCTNPDLDLRCRFHVADIECSLRVQDIVEEFPSGERCGLAVAREVSDRIRHASTALEVGA